MGSTLSTIRGNVRRNLGETTANFYTNAELNQYIGEAYKKYSMLMIEEGFGYFQTTINLGFTSGNPEVDLSSLSPTFYEVSQLSRWLSNSSTVPLKSNVLRFKINSTVSTGGGDSYLPYYKLRGQKIVLMPTPVSTEAPASTGQVTSGLKLEYVYVPDYPASDSADGFTFNAEFQITWEPLIELYATIRAMEAKDAMGGVSDIATFRESLSQYEANFLDSLQRDETPESVEQMGLDYGNSIWSGGGFY